ncbi:hypothetical protein [Paenibacillus validus]|uniref:hypothetical protein n=1 Tax=Paenibacillus validus TaxID=44253 RepID=UPI003D2E8EE0
MKVHAVMGRKKSVGRAEEIRMSREAGAAVIVRELEKLVRREREREKSGKTRESRRPGD